MNKDSPIFAHFSTLGSIRTDRKASASRANGAKGGRPPGVKDSYKRSRSKPFARRNPHPKVSRKRKTQILSLGTL